MAEGMFLEAEELGVVALIGVIVVPGIIWAAKGKSGGGILRRTLVLAGLVGAALAIEATLDRSANTLADAVTGNS